MITHILTFLMLASVASAQTSFEVASIRPSDPRIREGGTPRTQFAGPVFIANAFPLKRLILYAYNLQESQLKGGPEWIETELYDLSAKVADGADSSADMNRLRLRDLLTERFGLVVHTETKQASTFALRVHKNGPKLTPHRAGHETRVSSGVQQVNANGGDMDALARILSARLGQLVVNETELSGLFDFTLKWDANSDKGDGPSVFDALQQQLGLRLESRKNVIEVLVIDSARRSSEN